MRNITGPFAVKFVLEGKRQNDFLEASHQMSLD